MADVLVLASAAYYGAVIKKRAFVFALVLLFSSFAFTQTSSSAPSTIVQPPPIGLLSAEQTEKLLPPSVLYKGQQAPVQSRNSGGVRYPDGALIIVSLVDSSGYSTGVREKYQFFLYTERDLSFGDKSLSPGFYGAGFLMNNTLVVTDVSGRDLITAPLMTDSALKRPRPLQIVASPDGGELRLYLGRSYVTLPSAN